MAKLALNAAPTFTAKVKISVAGSKPVEVEFTFKHRTRKQLEEHVKATKAASVPGADDDVKVVMDSVLGWELDEPFTAENVAIFLDNYHNAGSEIMTAYGVELMQARQGN